MVSSQARAPRVSAIYGDSSEGATLVDVDSPHVQSVDPNFLNRDVKTSTQAERIEREQAQETGEGQHKVRKAKAEKSSPSKNKGNIVVLGNSLLIALAGAGLGFGAYRKHIENKLSWELIGIWSGAVGAFGVADYFISKWLFQKYPGK